MIRQQTVTCPQGHTWERPEIDPLDRLLCPTCGLELRTRLPPAPAAPLIPRGADDAALQTADMVVAPPQISQDAAPRPGTGLGAPAGGAGGGAADPAPRRGRFRIVRRHAQGGLGQVSIARDEDLGREVALKEIKPELAGSPRSRERFVHEARITGRLEHPNIVPVYALGRDEHGRPYYAMRFVKGRTLGQAIRDHHAAPSGRGLRDLLKRFVDVCQAIAYAHSRDVIHRDLKPANVMLGDYGETLILDWGLAKHLGERPPEGSVGDSDSAGVSHAVGGSHMTEAGQVLGTPAYMAPEQARQAASAGPAADVYSLGAILYEILQGHPPTRDGAPPPVSAGTNAAPAPRPLRAVCRKAMSADPVGRYASAAALGAEVERYLADEPVQAYRDPPAARLARWARRHKATAVGLAALLLTASLALAVSNVLVRAQRDQKVAALGEATLQTGLARAAEARARATLASTYARKGWELAEQDRPSMALLYFAHALQLDADDLDAQTNHRVQIATVLAGAPLPRAGATAEFHEQTVHGGRWLEWSPDQTAVSILDRATGKPVGPPLQHPSRVGTASFSPDGTRVVTASRHGGSGARVWDAATGRPLTPPLMPEPGDFIWSAQFSPDGSRVATVSQKDQLRLWDASTGRPLGPPVALGFEGSGAAFSPDGTKLLVAGGDGARLYDAATGQPLTGVMGRKCEWSNWDAQAVFTADGRRAATYNSADRVQVWDLLTGKPLSPELTCEAYPSLAFRPDGKQLAVGDGESLRLWDEAKPEAWDAPLGRGDEVGGVGYSADGRRVFAFWADGTARVWDAQTREPLTPQLPHPVAVRAATFATPDGARLVTIDEDRVVREWEVGAPRWADGVLGRPGRNHGAERSLSFDRDRKRFMVTSNGTTETRVRDAETNAPLTPPMRHTGPVYEALFSPDGGTVVTGTGDGFVRLWDAATGQPRTGPVPVGAAVESLEFSHDGRWFAVATDKGAVYVLDARTAAVRVTFAHGPRRAYVRVSADDRRLLTWDESTARVWDAATGRPVMPPLEHEGEIVWAAYSTDGRRVWTYGDRAVRAWDALSGAPAGPTIRHGGEMKDWAFSDDGRLVATAGRDRTARLWDARTGQPVTSPLPHAAKVKGVRFTPDARRLLSLDEQGVARLWDFRSGEALTPPMRGNVMWWLDVQFGAGGRTLAMENFYDGERRTWDVSPDPRPADDLVRIAELLAAHRLDAQGGVAPLTTAEWDARWQDLSRRYAELFKPPPVPTAPATTRTSTEGAK